MAKKKVKDKRFTEKDLSKQNGDLLGNFFQQPCAGIVTVYAWTMAPDNETYLYFHCPAWQVVTDKMWPVEGFRSTEKWQLVATDGHGKVLAIFPGCSVKAVIMSPAKPKRTKNIYAFV